MGAVASSASASEAATPTAQVSAVFIYPIKSCRGISVPHAPLTPTGLRWDRQWLVVNSKGRAYTQRVEPKLALIEAELPTEAFDEDWEPTNDSYMGGMIEQNYPHIFWTPCAAHCVDLMLEDIGKQVKVKRAIGRGQFIVNFIYNHTMALNIMRKFTGKMELVRRGVTRFATTFLTLQRLHNQQNALRKMFLSDEWSSTKIAKESKGKKVRDYVIMPSFWNDVAYSLKAMGPLVQVLRLVDNEKMPAMGYIYEAMDRAKESIATSFQNNQAKYADIFAIIDKRWECQLHHPLHAAGHYLNPKHFYNDPSIGRDREVRDGLYATIERLSKDPESNDEAICNLAIYRNVDGMFGKASAIRMRTTMSPVLKAPGMQPLKVCLSKQHEVADGVSVWEWTGSAWDEGAEASQWFSDYLGKPSRLVRFNTASEVRPVDPDYATGQQTMFSDGYPFLLASQESLDALNQLLKEPLPINRFRPNILVEGCEPFSEDLWQEIKISRFSFLGVKLCSRCKVPSINQETGISGPEPNETLMRTRSEKVLRPNGKQKNNIYFGQNIVWNWKDSSAKGNGKIINVGDPVSVLKKVSSADEAAA